MGRRTGFRRLLDWLVGLRLLLHHDRGCLAQKLMAGVAVTLVLIPSAIAYADLAKWPPIGGLADAARRRGRRSGPDRSRAGRLLHGLQVGIAAYLVGILQGGNTDRIAGLFDVTGFWDAVAEDPFSRSEWLQAIRAAPSAKEGYYTVLSSRDVLPEAETILTHDPHLRRCFQDRGCRLSGGRASSRTAIRAGNRPPHRPYPAIGLPGRPPVALRSGHCPLTLPFSG